MGVKRFTIAQIAAALRKHDGLIPRAASELKTARQAIHERISRSPELRAVLVEIEEDLRTDARGAIAAALKAGDMPTVRWFAERKMRDEGYGTKIDGPPLPPANNERRQTIINVLIQNLNAKAAAIHAEVHREPQGALVTPAR